MKVRMKVALGLALFPLIYPIYFYKRYQGMKSELQELRRFKQKKYTESLGINL